MEYKDAIKKRNKLIFSGIKTYYDTPIFISKGQNQYLFDEKNNKYLDFYAGVATSSMGYANEYINNKVKEQLNKIQHVPTLYLNEPMLDLAENILRLFGNDGYKVMYCNSGSEGVEFLTLLSRQYRKNGYILSMSQGYHGMTLFANYLTGIEGWKHHGEIQLNSVAVDTPYCYRCRYKNQLDECGFECTLSVEKAMKNLGKENIGGMVFETILGVAGVITPPKKYFDIVTRMIKEYGGLILVDEVQTGMGRTGKWFGFENYDFIPDAFCLGKSLANGLPLGAVVAKDELSELTNDLSIYSTFGGNPISTVHSKAAIEVMEKQNILEHINKMGDLLKQKLEAFYNYDCIGEIRGKGLMIGIEFIDNKEYKKPNPSLALKIQNELRNARILVGLGGIYKNVIRIAPPYIITKEDIEFFVLELNNTVSNLTVKS